MITISFDPQQVITWLLIGLFAGFLASIIVRGRGMGLLASIIVGLVGALVGGFLFSILNIQIPSVLAEGITLRYIDIIVSLIGALIVLLLVSRFWRGRL
jgi:uncharacterized membrane protein YeaQ/YmgE (transglycosylase-associated protein family)